MPLCNRLQIGQRVKAQPYALNSNKDTVTLIGRIVYISERFRWVTVQYKNFRESFYTDEVTAL